MKRDWAKDDPRRIAERKRDKDRYLKRRAYLIEYGKKYREDNREELNEKKRSYRHVNSDRVKDMYRKAFNRRYSSEPVFRLISLCRRRINHSILEKNSSSAELLGADIGVVYAWIESQFEAGMTWENQGKYGWHIDHVIPLAVAKSRDELLGLFHYINLQPLWANENWSKSSKIVMEDGKKKRVFNELKVA